MATNRIAPKMNLAYAQAASEVAIWIASLGPWLAELAEYEEFVAACTTDEPGPDPDFCPVSGTHIATTQRWLDAEMDEIEASYDARHQWVG